jgi:hypothetical protein
MEDIAFDLTALGAHDGRAYLRCWAQAAHGDPAKLRQWVRREARRWQASSEEEPEVPPSLYTVRRSVVLHREYEAFRSPQVELVERTAALLNALSRRDELWRLRALHCCARCAVMFVQGDGRRDRGPRIVCEGCRPEERLERVRLRQARSRAARADARGLGMSRGKSLLLPH